MTDMQQTAQGPIDEEELRSAVEEMLDALVETMPELIEQRPNVDNEGVLQATVDIVGAEPATLTIRADFVTAAHLAIGWGLATPDTASMEDAVDALSEFANVVGGSVKLIFQSESSLGIPSVEVLDSAQGAVGLDSFLVIFHSIGQLGIQLVQN